MADTKGTAPVISVEGVSMYFKLPTEQAGSLKEYFIGRLTGKTKYNTLKALENITFQVWPGEVIGIIGTNGSGKSTLLKIISGAMPPTKGRIEASQEKIQLLTLGTGFDRELTARENVYLNGAILGYTREFIREKYDDIVQFAELEGFMEQKIRNFSSGMISRLGFAVATAKEDPGILILDEVLSVGDMFFKEKSGRRIRQMIETGEAVLIVSHSTETILNYCTRAIWIEKGVQKMAGRPEDVCRAYVEYGGRKATADELGSWQKEGGAGV